MAQDLIEKLNDLARAFADAQNAQYTSNLTRSRGRVLAVQWTLFNRNRRDCWGAVQCSSPLEVKRVIWKHESEELINDPRCGSDHYSLHVRRCLALGLTAEEVEKCSAITRLSRRVLRLALHRQKPAVAGGVVGFLDPRAQRGSQRSAPGCESGNHPVGARSRPGRKGSGSPDCQRQRRRRSLGYDGGDFPEICHDA